MSAEASPARPMKYPYTFSAKAAQFPFKFYYNNSWLFKYWIFGSILCLPVFYKLQRLSYSPENVKKWEKIRKEQFSGKHH